MQFFCESLNTDDPLQTPALTPNQVRSEHKMALAEFMEARQATLTVDIYGGSRNPSMGGMTEYHKAALRFEAAKANCTKWAHRVASL
jgi:hypothetical protein